MNVQVLHFINKSLKPLKKKKNPLLGLSLNFIKEPFPLLYIFLSMTIYNSKTAIPDEVYLFIFYF